MKTSNFIFNGIDRMDNEIGYTAERCGPLLQDLNSVKRTPFRRVPDMACAHYRLSNGFIQAMPSLAPGEVKNAA